VLKRHFIFYFSLIYCAILIFKKGNDELEWRKTYECRLRNSISKSYCSTVHFHRITSIYQPTNAHIISHKTLLNTFKHFKTLRYVSILSDHHQGALFLAKVLLRYSQFNSYLQMRCCGSISCCVGMCCGAVARCAYDSMSKCLSDRSGTMLGDRMVSIE